MCFSLDGNCNGINFICMYDSSLVKVIVIIIDYIVELLMFKDVNLKF